MKVNGHHCISYCISFAPLSIALLFWDICTLKAFTVHKRARFLLYSFQTDPVGSYAAGSSHGTGGWLQLAATFSAANIKVEQCQTFANCCFAAVLSAVWLGWERCSISVSNSFLIWKAVMLHGKIYTITVTYSVTSYSVCQSGSKMMDTKVAILTDV